VDEALELGPEDHVHEQEAGQEGNEEVLVRLAHHLGPAEELVSIVGREAQAVDVLAEFLHGLTQRLVAFEVGGHHDLALHAVAVNRGRSLGRLERGEVRQVYQARPR
jgi:hypothetical protein